MTDDVEFIDDLTVKSLPSKLVRDARKAELVFLGSFPVYIVVPRLESVGCDFVDCRWIDINKGDSLNFNVKAFWHRRAVGCS